MSEYIEIKTEETEDPNMMIFHTNLELIEGATEHYNDAERMEEGSAVAQAMSPIEGLSTLIIERKRLIITRNPDIPWHFIISEVTVGLKDFFL